MSAAALLVTLRDRSPDAPRNPESRTPQPASRGRDSAGLAGNAGSRDAGINDLESRLARLERRLAELERPPDDEPAPNRPGPEIAAEAKSLAATAADPAAHPETRVAALKKLRKVSPASREGAVTGSLVVLLRASDDPRLRAEVIRNLYGVRDQLLREELLYRLRADPDVDVRDEAAESLDVMLDDPAVVSALEWARDHDPDERVRGRAAASLAARKQE